MMIPRVLPAFLLVAVTLIGADKDVLKSEPNLERRSALALSKADEHLTEARRNYEAGNIDDFKRHMNAAKEMTEASYQALQDSGKRARRSPKWFKNAEQRLMVMLRRVDTLSRDVNADDKPVVDAAQKRMREVHDQLVQDIMTRK